MTTYKNSAGKVIPIAEMNPYHLHFTIIRFATLNRPEHAEILAALRAEQEKRGGPPNRGDIEEEKP